MTEEEKEIPEKQEKEKEKLPFPEAAIVRIMKSQLDKEKMIKKDVKVAMNKWLATLCKKVSKEMNKVPYVMLHSHEFNKAKETYDTLEKFAEEKKRILAHLDAMKKDVERLEKDLGKVEEEFM